MKRRNCNPLVRTALAILAWMGAGMMASCDGLFFFPDQAIYATPEGLSLQVESVRFAPPDGPELQGWWIPAEGEPIGTVVYCNGNQKNLTFYVRTVSWFPKHGFNLLVFDYRGYGQSAGEPTREGLVADTVAAIDVALARDPHRTVVFGHSIGGAMGIIAAAQRPAVRAVAVESTFSSYRDLASAHVPLSGLLVPLMVSEGCDPIRSVGDLAPRPFYVIHGEKDDATPLVLGRDLFAAAGQPKRMRVVPEGEHKTPWLDEGVAFERDLCRFFADALGHGAR